MEYQHKKILHDFKGWESAICCCVSSPALDVVDVGCFDVTVHDHKI
jgi:U3 small nucleolar RNA-associated protein 21